MRIDTATVVIRPRNPWEAMDLGFRMVQTFWRSVFPVWVTIAGGTLLLLIVLTGGRLLPAALLFWWLKPAYDRVLLKIFSQLIFGKSPGFVETLRQLPSIFSTGLWINLTLLRFNPSRSFHLPVWGLEGLRGETRVQRIRTLSQGIRSYPLWLLIACQSMEQVLAFSPLILLALFMPQGYGGELLDQLIGATPKPLALEVFTYSVYFAAIVIVEPLYVAAGFMLYIDRRTKLEGWDIELSFRQMAARLKHLARTAALLLGVGLLTHTAPVPARIAQQTATPTAQYGALTRTRAKTTIAKVLDEKPFNQTTTEYHWVPRTADNTAVKPPGWMDELGPVLHYIAWLFRGAIWVMAIGLTVLFLIYLRRHPQPPGRADSDDSHTPLDSLAGLNLRAESLPGDVAGAALDLFGQGRFRQGLGLLYRATLAELQRHDGMRLNAGDTEADVLRRARQQLSPPRTGCLENLTRLWRQQAYGHQPPSLANARMLVSQWREHFGKQS